MTRATATDARVLEVGATPTLAVTDASLRSGERALTQAPLGTEKSAIARLILVDASIPNQAMFEQLLTQLYHVPTSAIRPVPSWGDVVAEIQRHSRIEALVILSHAGSWAAQIGSVQKTPTQIADLLYGQAPPIGSLTFDGCKIGNDLAGLHDLATKVGIAHVYAWTFWHYMDWWRVVPTGDPAQALAKFRTAAVLAEPYLPKDVMGQRTYSVADQEAAFAAKSLRLVAEIFVESFSGVDGVSFESLVLDGKLDPAVHRPRGSADHRLIDSGGAQAAMETELQSSRPTFARVDVTPW